MQSEAMAFSKEYDKSYEISVPVSSRCRLNMPVFFQNGHTDRNPTSISHCMLMHNKKLVPWGTDGRLPLSGDFRSLILE